MALLILSGSACDDWREADPDSGACGIHGMIHHDTLEASIQVTDDDLPAVAFATYEPGMCPYDDPIETAALVYDPDTGDATLVEDFPFSSGGKVFGEAEQVVRSSTVEVVRLGNTAHYVGFSDDEHRLDRECALKDGVIACEPAQSPARD